MSLTNSSTFRTPIAQSIEPSIDGNCAERHSTTFEQVNDLLDRLMGPSEYHGVYLLNRAADYCSDQCLIESTKPGPFCQGFADACQMLSRIADSLDAYLVASYLERQAN